MPKKYVENSDASMFMSFIFFIICAVVVMILVCCLSLKKNPVDCQVTDWSNAGDCSVPKCGGGTVLQTRTVKIQPSNGGKTCPVLSQTIPCNTDPCPQNCQVSVWSEYTPCTKDCNGGEQSRTRTVIKEPANGGDECPSLLETRQCNLQNCPIDCVLGDWGEYSTCNKTCGGGTKTRSRKIIVGPQYGGKPCGPTIETVPCNPQACPVSTSNINSIVIPEISKVIAKYTPQIIFSPVPEQETKKSSYSVPSKFNFSFTGNNQIFYKINASKIKIEIWGAQGGGGRNYFGIGGKGGYSFGDYLINQNIFVVIGQKGNQETESYNGGGQGTKSVEYGNGFSGGGATHVALSGGELKSLSNKLSDVIIVAGGGGGAAGTILNQPQYIANGGAGGGSVGKNGFFSSDKARPGGDGGTQTAGGISGIDVDINQPTIPSSFGQGATALQTINPSSIQGGGGGGGWYGGGSGSYSGGGGGGGSGFIGNTQNPSKLTNANTQEGIWEGNGFCTITVLDIFYYDKFNSITFEYTGDSQVFNKYNAKKIKIEVWGAQGGGPGNDNGFGTGGLGGYSSGEYIITNDKLFVIVGAQGNQTTKSYNGGGIGNINPANNTGQGFSGGGATHVALSDGELFNLSDKKSDVLIVAGGGGGAGGVKVTVSPSFKTNGGVGGGLIGGTGQSVTGEELSRVGGTGGTQNAGGISYSQPGYPESNAFENSAFGLGASGSKFNNDAVQGGGGGGGYYGGGAGSEAGGGGGGSGYIEGVTSASTQQGVRNGNGLVKITILEVV